MEGKLDPESGEYEIETGTDYETAPASKANDTNQDGS